MKQYIIDFDSTVTQVEGLDLLAKVALKNSSNRNEVVKEIEMLTNLGMEGKLSFEESLQNRIAILQANEAHLQILVKLLKKRISTSFARNKAFFKANAKHVYIVSGGFKEFIIPVVSSLGILPENVYANTFIFDKQKNIVGYDTKNVLSKEGGKVQWLKQMALKGEVYAIGDGYSDYQLKNSGLIKGFFAFTENIARASVVSKADFLAPSFDEFLYINQLPMSISYPKNRIGVVCLGDVSETSLQLFKKEGYSLLTKEEIAESSIVYAHKANDLPKDILLLAPKMKAIGVLDGIKDNTLLDNLCQNGIVLFDDAKKNPRNETFIPKRIIDYINKGDSNLSSNFPNIMLHKVQNAHRLIHIHQNVPGIMAKLNNVLAQYGLNIEAQYLKTNKHIGYVITDVNQEYDKSVLNKLKKIDNTIKFRVLY